MQYAATFCPAGRRREPKQIARARGTTWKQGLLALPESGGLLDPSSTTPKSSALSLDKGTSSTNSRR